MYYGHSTYYGNNTCTMATDMQSRHKTCTMVIALTMAITHVVWPGYMHYGHGRGVPPLRFWLGRDNVPSLGGLTASQISMPFHMKKPQMASALNLLACRDQCIALHGLVARNALLLIENLSAKRRGTQEGGLMASAQLS